MNARNGPWWLYVSFPGIDWTYAALRRSDHRGAALGTRRVIREDGLIVVADR
jgi:hypothetical protein